MLQGLLGGGERLTLIRGDDFRQVTKWDNKVVRVAFELNDPMYGGPSVTYYLKGGMLESHTTYVTKAMAERAAAGELSFTSKQSKRHKARSIELQLTHAAIERLSVWMDSALERLPARWG